MDQWYPTAFEVDGDWYPTAEHWMMATKAVLRFVLLNLVKSMMIQASRNGFG